MRFPWKKVQGAAISRLVNDHLHKSQKRRDGSSLVVETGFPTSLVDLFIKNREKLRNPSIKSRQSPQLSADPSISGSPRTFPSPPPPPAPAPSPVICPLDCSSTQRSSSLSTLPSSGVNEISVTGLSDGCKSAGSVDFSKNLLVVFKVFWVVCCTLGSKRLIGWDHCLGVLAVLPGVCGEACRWIFEAIFRSQRDLDVEGNCVLSRFEEVKLDGKSDGLLMPEMQKEHSLKRDCSSPTRRPNQEIQIDESEERFQHCEEAVIEKGETNHDLAELKRTKSRREKIKSKMKKYFPKKFRSSRKGNDPQRNEQQEVYQHPDEGESEGVNINGLPASITSARNKEEAATIALSRISELAEVSEEFGTNSPGEIRTPLTWRYSVLLIVVLIGLIGGRAFALLLTLSSCLLLKFVELLLRHMNW